jgi:hypothetical protein
MSTRSINAAVVTTVLVALGSLSASAADQPMPMHSETHVVAIEHQVETAKTQADHEAVAQRFEEEAAQFEKQAAEHERLAAQYRKAPGNPKWNNNSTALATHCDRLVKNLKASAKEAHEMAQLHHDVAKLVAQ